MSLELPPLTLYIHLPWCVKKCPYCDFNSHGVVDQIPEKEYVWALLRDLDLDLPQVEGRRLESVFFGGGTPSLFSPDAIHVLIDSIKSRIICATGMEVTLEANPGTVEIAKFKAFKDAGVNRLSIGVQSFQARQLQSLGRIHNATEAVRAAESARNAGIDNFNLDLMYGLPGQTRKEASDDILQALALEPSHLSYYQLTIEANTAFAKLPPVLPSEDVIWEIQCENQALLADRGFRQYEISGYAKHGFQCRHNLNYWTYGDYLGIGAGAHSKTTDVQNDIILRASKVRNPGRYLQAAGTDQGVEDQKTIPKFERSLEYLMNALRLNEGFDKMEFKRRTGLRLSDLQPTLSECFDEELLEDDGIHIRCTDNSRNFLDAILARFVPDL